MVKARLMNKADDFKKLGVNPNAVEMWEDGKRNDPKPGYGEEYYFDVITEDGFKVVIYFHASSPMDKIDGYTPEAGIMVTTPDGKTHSEGFLMKYEPEQIHLGTEKCDIQAGPHTATGDFKTYDVHIEPEKGIGADLHYEALVDPFRQGTAEVALGEHDEYFYTDLSVPKLTVTGTVFVNGQKYDINGQGYHDHQWMNISQLQAWHHWLWGHLYTEHYTVVIYDFVTSERFGFANVPLFGVFDNQTGKLIFETDGNMNRQTEVYLQEKTQKEFPKVSNYIFKNHDGTEVEFRVEAKEEIEIRDMYGDAQPEIRQRFDAIGLKPAYVRYFAKGSLTLAIDGQTITESGDMIYEYPYIGKEDERANV
ncbi:lipocalin-like domain-containing protein [Weissella fangxianensis]|uniref:lipocalin-like domain-containing protein n=1 Tax=Weissella fangxianensis TaxID=2953879 RepID=UPI002157CE0F|nr:lipocalin-like domain-containing protein [Weissella fangxianensis]